MNFFDLQQELSKYQLEIFTLNDLVKITDQTKEVLTTTLNRLVKSKKLIRLKKGYYAQQRIENKLLLQKIFKDTYIALHSALQYYESTTQRFNNLELISDHVYYKQTVQDTNITFHHAKKLFFGFKKIRISKTDVFISTIEKTIIDCVYFSKEVYLSEVSEFIRKYKEHIDKDILTTYLQKINSSALNKRVGYLCSLHDIHLVNLNTNAKYERLNKNLGNTKKKDTKWKLILNEEL